MNIYGSLMDIFDEKRQKSFMTKKTKDIYVEKKREHKQKWLYAPIINRNIQPYTIKLNAWQLIPRF